MSQYEPKDLLYDRNPNAPLGPFDGASACVKGELVITSPNQDNIPQAPWGQRDVRIRADFRYGFDDYTLWPQAYVVEYPHLGSIPRKRTNFDDPLRIMWWDPTKSDFLRSPNGLIKDLGQLAPIRFEKFNDMKEQLLARVQRYQEAVDRPNAMVLSLSKAMQHACLRLGFLSTSYQEMRFGVTEFQRYYLEVVGALDYLEIYKPRIDGIAPRPVNTADCVGAFTTTPRVVQDFFDAGLPVFLVRKFPDLFTLPRPNILALVEPIIPDKQLVLSDSQPPFPSIFRGYTNTSAKHAAMHKYSRTWMVYSDPFGEESSEDPFSTGRGPATASQSIPMVELMRERLPPSRGQPTARPNLPSSSNISRAARSGGRDKFLEFESPFLPPAMPMWANALRAVDRNPLRLVQRHKAEAHYGHYALPEPGLFVSPASDEKKAAYLFTWLRARPALLYRFFKRQSTALSNQTWRDFLEMGRKQGVEEGTKSAKSRDLIRRVMGSSFEALLDLDASSTEIPPVLWRGQELPANQMPAPPIAQQILWELFELNFRIELFSLDCRASSADFDIVTRLKRIQNCFVDADLLCTHIPHTNQGLVADDWRRRLPFLLALMEVLLSWYGSPPNLKQLSRNASQRALTKEQTAELEREITIFYTQTYYDYFGRAALLPHCVSPFAIS